MVKNCAALHQTAAQLTLPPSVLDRTGNKYGCYRLWGFVVSWSAL